MIILCEINVLDVQKVVKQNIQIDKRLTIDRSIELMIPDRMEIKRMNDSHPYMFGISHEFTNVSDNIEGSVESLQPKDVASLLLGKLFEVFAPLLQLLANVSGNIWYEGWSLQHFASKKAQKGSRKRQDSPLCPTSMVGFLHARVPEGWCTLLQNSWTSDLSRPVPHKVPRCIFSPGEPFDHQHPKGCHRSSQLNVLGLTCRAQGLSKLFWKCLHCLPFQKDHRLE